MKKLFWGKSRSSKANRYGMHRRRALLESLEPRVVLTSNPPNVFIYVDTGLPHEGSNESLTDSVEEWRLNLDIQDDEGGTFDLAFDLNNDGIYGDPGEPTQTITVPARPFDQVDTFHWNIDWDDMTALGMGDTHAGMGNFSAHVQVTEVLPEGNELVALSDTDINVQNSMPFFGIVTPTQAPGVGGACGGGSPGAVTLNGAFTEYGMSDLVTLRINWGDGNSELVLDGASVSDQRDVAFSKDHNYASPGSYNITWEIWDDEGGEVSLAEHPESVGGITGFAVTGGGGGGEQTVCLDDGELIISGYAGVDSVSVTPSGGDILVSANFPNAPFTFPAGSVNQIVISLGDGNDDVQVAGSVTTPVWIFGGAGDDRIKGGGGNDVVAGGEGADLLVGGGGRDLIIGGEGADRLVGNNDDDILIAGKTTLEANATALLAIMAEWGSADTYSQRVSSISASYLLVDGPNATVSDDNAVDVLTGAGGVDWFLLNMDGAAIDKATDLHADEFAADLDWITS